MAFDAAAFDPAAFLIGGIVAEESSPAMLASVPYPKLLQHLRWCRNGSYPDAWLIRQAATALAHVQAYRRKVFAVVGGDFGSGSSIGLAGTTNYWRFRCRTGYGATQMRFKLGLGQDFHATGTDPRVTVSVTPFGGAADTKTVYYGNAAGVYVDDEPLTINNSELRFDVSPATTYEVVVSGVDYGRPLEFCAYEWADPNVDQAVDYYVELLASVTQPIYDVYRERLLTAASQLWLENGPQLLSWCGRGSGAAISQTGTTWLNVVDGTSTAISAATPGYYFDVMGTGDELADTLKAICRYSVGTLLPVTLAAYANTSAGSTGEVRLADGSGAVGSLTGITTTLQWHTTDITLASVDTLAKLDLQVRNGTGGQTTNVYAVSLYTRV